MDLVVVEIELMINRVFKKAHVIDLDPQETDLQSAVADMRTKIVVEEDIEIVEMIDVEVALGIESVIREISLKNQSINNLMMINQAVIYILAALVKLLKNLRVKMTLRLQLVISFIKKGKSKGKLMKRRKLLL